MFLLNPLLYFVDYAITHHVVFSEGAGWRTKICGKELARFPLLPFTASTADAIRLIRDIASSRLCIGNIDLDYVQSSHRSSDCDTILSSNVPITTVRCSKCSLYRGSLRKQKSRINNSQKSSTADRVAASSSTPMSSLSSNELMQRCHNLSQSRKTVLRVNSELKKRIKQLMEEQAMPVDNELSDVCKDTLTEKVTELPSGSVQRFFIEEQLKVLSATTSTTRRWHPTILRWCLLMHKKSSTLYRYIRESKFICLPSERTLCDYRSYKPTNSGESLLLMIHFLSIWCMIHS